MAIRRWQSFVRKLIYSRFFFISFLRTAREKKSWHFRDLLAAHVPNGTTMTEQIRREKQRRTKPDKIEWWRMARMKWKKVKTRQTRLDSTRDPSSMLLRPCRMVQKCCRLRWGRQTSCCYAVLHAMSKKLTVKNGISIFWRQRKFMVCFYRQRMAKK